MKLENFQILALFKDMYLFSGLSEEQLNWACSLFKQVEYPAAAPIFTPGDLPDGFYIIGAGEVHLTQSIENTMIDVDLMVAGDFFGEEALLLRRPHQVAVSTVGETILLKAEIPEFNELIAVFPGVRVNLERVMQSRVFVRKHNFPWLSEDEVIYQVRRKHEAFLLVVLFWPTMVVLLSLIIALVGVVFLPASLMETSFLVVMVTLAVAGAIWGLWNWIDWSNDYYIITNQRVVWIEQVIWLYQSRVEAPNNTIKGVDMNRQYLGRLLKYGNIEVSTTFGRIILRNVGEPNLMKALIEEQWRRSQKRYQRSEEEELKKTVHRIIENAPPLPAVKDAAPPPRDDFEEPSIGVKYFSNIFKMRFEDGETITYRKHWIYLITRAWKPTLTILLLLMAQLGCVIGYYLDEIKLVPPSLFIGVSSLLLLVIVLPWWLYNYVDWRNDIYRLTEDKVFDIERKPFGSESSKSAPLASILTLEHERPGFVGYLLNVGNVVVNCGDIKLNFEHVYQPARIQQDIFNRMHQLRLRQQRVEVARERERFLRMLEVYHQDVNENI